MATAGFPSSPRISNFCDSLSSKSYSCLNREEKICEHNLGRSDTFTGSVAINRLEFRCYGGISGKNVPEDDEIEVFGAERYYLEDMDRDNHPETVKYGRPGKFRYAKDKEPLFSIPGIDDQVHSVPSWYGHNALLQTDVMNYSEEGFGKRRKSKGLFASFVCKCLCSSDKTDEKEGEHIAIKRNRYVSSHLSDRTRQPTTAEESSGVYPPSERSITWSVITASAADQSLMTDWEATQISSREEDYLSTPFWYLKSSRSPYSVET